MARKRYDRYYTADELDDVRAAYVWRVRATTLVATAAMAAAIIYALVEGAPW